MAELILEPGATAQWQQLVRDAENRCGARLDEDAQSYLVFLLMRYLRRSDLIRRLLAIAYLQAMASQGRARADRLRDVGDECLLLGGLFPGQIRRRRVTLDYVIDLGQGAYGELGASDGSALASLFGKLAQDFPLLLDVLGELRRNPDTDSLDRMALAAHRFLESGSPAARRELERAHGRLIGAPGADLLH
ncbi:hypothetical protein M0534_02820 [Methylonatrum kenyense]|uniref:hypothetical protein n=1 Tax=Methylonatrum kenyense TaxID=455253 RepID=UPI0020BEE160|nr:hypothetical protein [Methylonatrum kenyense]MCK8515267.1 hypothetical protein [Methylonatrum kenyense]